MQYLEIYNMVNFKIDNSPNGTAAAFTAAEIKKGINYAYRKIIRQAKLEGSRRWFKAVRKISWPASQVQLVLPGDIRQKGLIRVSDVTSNDPGQRILFDENGLAGDVFWYDRNTLQWGTSGPSAAKTLKFEFFAEPSWLEEDEDEPDLIPEEYHDLLAWEAAKYLLIVADGKIPESWDIEINALSGDLWKAISKGRPNDDVPQVYDVAQDEDAGY